MKRTILVIDDNPRFAMDFGAIMKNGNEVHAAYSGEEGLEKYRALWPDVILLDLNLGAGMDGLEVLEKLRQEDIDTPVIIITENDAYEAAFAAAKLGAYFYTTKIPDLGELFRIIDHELKKVAWKKHRRQERERWMPSFIGESPAIKEIWRQVEKIAPLEVPVLITGETGTGKEIIASAIHERSNRRENPLYTINCSNLQPERFENELFGHEKGSFTGADKLHKGLFEAADASSLFLDEVGDLPIASQPKILRAIENKTFQRVGGTATLSSDVRIIAATHQNLEAMIAAGKFREDLFYRLARFTLHIPPLRQRREDIPLLVNYFVEKISHEYHRRAPVVPPRIMEFLQHHPWPGNVRQLQSVLEAAMIDSDEGTLSLRSQSMSGTRQESASFSFDEFRGLPYAEAKKILVDRFQRDYVYHALVRNDWNISQTAEETGIHRSTIHEIVKEAGWREVEDEKA